MSIGGLLFASIIGTALVFHKELSAQPRIVVYDPFPQLTTPEQTSLYERMNAGYNNRNYAASIEAAETLMKIFPNSPWLYIERGLSFGQTGRYEEGIADLTRALELDGASDAGKTYSLGGNRYKLLDDINLMRNMIVARDRALAEVAHSG